MTTNSLTPQDPLTAALGDAMTAHALKENARVMEDTASLTVIGAIRASLRPLLPRMLDLPLIGGKTVRAFQNRYDSKLDLANDDMVINGILSLGPGRDRWHAANLHLPGRTLSIIVPSENARRFNKTPPHIKLTEQLHERFETPRSPDAEYSIDTPPSVIVAAFCAMFVKHVDFAALKAQEAGK